jgi:hypothetical protein
MLTTIYSFCSSGTCSGGDEAIGNLVAGSDGNIYGVTASGGPSCTAEPSGCGTAFQITPNGTYTPMHVFCTERGCPDGWLPTGLVQATWGAFYGTTSWGGLNPACPDSDRVYNCGTIFKLSNGLSPFVLAQPAVGPGRIDYRDYRAEFTGGQQRHFQRSASDIHDQRGGNSDHGDRARRRDQRHGAGGSVERRAFDQRAFLFSLAGSLAGSLATLPSVADLIAVQMTAVARLPGGRASYANR